MMELRRCVLRRDNHHLYILQGKDNTPQYDLNNAYGLNQLNTYAPSLDDIKHHTPDFNEIVTFACINYLLAILGVKPTAISSSTKGFIATYYDSEGQFFGTFNIGRNPRELNSVCNNIFHEFRKQLINAIPKIFQFPNILNGLTFSVDKDENEIMKRLDKACEISDQAREKAKLYYKIMTILKTNNLSLLDKCLKINELVNNEIQIDFSNFNSIDNNNCRENHRVICKILCGKDEDLAKALEQYISIKEKTETRFRESRQRDLIPQCGDYMSLPNDEIALYGLPAEKQVRLSIVCSVFDVIYDRIITLYYLNSGEPVMARDGEEVYVSSYLPATNADTLRDLASDELMEIVSDGLNELKSLGILPTSTSEEYEGYMRRAITAIHNICVMDFSLPLVSRVMMAVKRCSSLDEFNLSSMGFTQTIRQNHIR